MIKSNNYTELPYMGGALIVNAVNGTLDHTYNDIVTALLNNRSVYIYQNGMYVDINLIGHMFGVYGVQSIAANAIYTCEDINSYPAFNGDGIEEPQPSPPIDNSDAGK